MVFSLLITRVGKYGRIWSFIYDTQVEGFHIIHCSGEIIRECCEVAGYDRTTDLGLRIEYMDQGELHSLFTCGCFDSNLLIK